MLGIQVLILPLAVLVTVAVGLRRPQEVRFYWKYLNYTWESPGQYHDAMENGDYIPKNNAFSGIKIYNGQLYLSIPRVRNGVPATLVKAHLKLNDGNRSPNLKPYPNWKMQKIGDCEALQFVQGMEIDTEGRMWVLDSGRNAYFDDNEALCPPRLVILDLNDNGKSLLSYQFPQKVVNPKTGLLNDIVLDHTDGGYAYITNSDSKKPSIVVFSLDQKTSWSITHISMYATAPIYTVKNDKKVTRSTNIDGIALSPASTEGQRIVYYCPRSSYQLFSIPSDVLKRNPQHFGSKVKLVGKRPSQTDGMMIDASGELYFGLLADNQVSQWNIKETPFNKYQHAVFEDNVNLMWQDTFAIDASKKLWVTSNRLERVYVDQIDISQVNFRVVLLKQLNYLSYQYYEDDTAPTAPEIALTAPEIACSD